MLWKSVLPQGIYVYNCITYKMSLGIAIPYLKRLEGLLYDAAREASQQLEPLRQQIVDWPSTGSTFEDSYELVRKASLMVHQAFHVGVHCSRGFLQLQLPHLL